MPPPSPACSYNDQDARVNRVVGDSTSSRALLHNNIGKVVNTLVTLLPTSIGIVVETRKVAAIMKEVCSAANSRL